VQLVDQTIASYFSAAERRMDGLDGNERAVATKIQASA
jgi:hypothetical protein